MKYIKFNGDEYGFYTPEIHGEDIKDNPEYQPIDEEYYEYLISHQGEARPDPDKELTADNLIQITLTQEELDYIKELQDKENERLRNETIEKLKTQGLIQENENLKSIIWELIPGINLTGGEIMLIEMLANQIIFGNRTFKDVPQPLKAKVKEQLDLMGCGFLAE